MTKETKIINSSLVLPSKHTLSNRIAKAATTEHLAAENGLPNEKHFNLYKRWSTSGAAFLLTGNVMVDFGSLEGKGNVVLDKTQPAEPFQKWAEIVTEGGGELWMQIGHAGGLSPCKNALSPSGIQHIGKVRQFPKPRTAGQAEIKDIVARFAYAASVAKKTGFKGVEIHSAHGFLLNQFLSPATNKRTDEWGGSLENRMRLLLEVVRAVKSEVGKNYPVGVKLNSSDGLGREGQWKHEESVQVAEALSREKIDFLDISGGSYEATPMLGPQTINEMEKRPEAFFLQYARNVKSIAPKLPIMLTAGMRSTKIMSQVIEEGIAEIIGMARPFIAIPDIPNRLLSGELDEVPRFYGESLPVMEQLRWFWAQIDLMAEGKEPNLSLVVGEI